MLKKNQDIRSAIKKARLTQWIVAEKLGVSEATFTRKLRHELSSEEKSRVYEAIKEAQKELIGA